MINVDPGEGGGGGAGGGSLPSTYFTLTPATQTISVAGTNVSVTASWAGGTVGLLTPGSIPMVSGVPIIVTPSVTTTYSLTFTPTSGSPQTLTSVITVGGIAGVVTRYMDVKWNYTEPAPLGSCSGFEVLFFVGADPNNTDMWLAPLALMTPIDRRYQTQLTLVPPVTVNCAIRSLYANGKKSGWRLIAIGVLFI